MDYTEIRDDRIRSKICTLMSEMLDNPDKDGLYQTSKFMWEMETFILAENKRFKETLEHIAENGCAKCGNVAEQALQGRRQ